jgi:hypothetical protein
VVVADDGDRDMTNEVIYDAYIDVEVVAEGLQQLVPQAPDRTGCRGQEHSSRRRSDHEKEICGLWLDNSRFNRGR